MGLFDFISSTLFGTEGQAQAKNEASVKQALALVLGVPIEAISDQAIAQITGKAEQTIGAGYDRAVGLVGQAGTGAALDTQAAARRSKGEARANLLQRGLSSSSLLTGAQTGIQEQANRTNAGILGGVAGAQGGLVAQKGQALGAATQHREALLADLFQNRGSALQNRANSAANILGGVQYQGTPGLAGPLLGAFAGGFGGGLGQLGGQLAGNLFGT